MSTDENKAVVRRFLEAGNEKNIAAVVDCFDPQGRFPILARFGVEPTFENYKKFLLSFFAALPDGHLAIEEMVAEGDKVWVRFMIRGTHRGPLRNIPATNNEVRYSGIGMYRVGNGKIIEVNNLFDDLTLLRQLGVITAV